MLHILLEYRSGILFIRLKGNLDRKQTYKINNYLIPTLLNQNINRAVININKIIKIDDFGIDSLENINSAIKSNKGKIYFVDNNSLIKKLHFKKVIKEENAFNGE